MKNKTPEIMFMFVKEFKSRGTTIAPGIVLKGDLIVTASTVSVRGSETFKDIPLDSLKLHTPTIYKKSS